MKIYTKTGDDGKTSLFDNTRVWKSNERIMAYGTIDELNSTLGIAISLDLDEEIKKILIKIQNDLFVVGSDLANPDMSNTKIRTTEKMVDFLEKTIDDFEPELPVTITVRVWPENVKNAATTGTVQFFQSKALKMVSLDPRKCQSTRHSKIASELNSVSNKQINYIF